MVRQLTSMELQADNDHTILATRVEDLKSNKDALVNYLSSQLVARETHGVNLGIGIFFFFS